MSAPLPECVRRSGARAESVLDVRPVLDRGGDPFTLIMRRAGELAADEALHLIVGFELVGFAGSVVVGQMYKIVPFLVWLHRFAPYVGLKRVPAAAELLAERPKNVQFALMHAGVVAFLAGVIADAAPLRVCGAVAFVASSLLFVRNLGVVMARQP